MSKNSRVVDATGDGDFLTIQEALDSGATDIVVVGTHEESSIAIQGRRRFQISGRRT